MTGKEQAFDFALEMYFEVFYFHLINMYDDLPHDSLEDRLDFDRDSLFEYVPAVWDDERVIEKAHAEVQQTILRSDREQLAKYRFYVFRRIAYYESKFKEGIEFYKINELPERISLRGKLLSFKLAEVGAKVYEPVSKQEHVLACDYAALFFYLRWTTFKGDISHDFAEPPLEDLDLAEPSEEESETLTLKQQIAVLDQLGVFDSPIFINVDATAIARVVAPLIGKNYKNTYDAIRLRHSLKTHAGTNKVINALFAHLKLNKRT